MAISGQEAVQVEHLASEKVDLAPALRLSDTIYDGKSSGF